MVGMLSPKQNDVGTPVKDPSNQAAILFGHGSVSSFALKTVFPAHRTGVDGLSGKADEEMTVGRLVEPPPNPRVRRHDIDWLRVILFGLLIPFHIAIGVYWTAYGDHVNPNMVEEVDVSATSDDERNLYTAESVDPMSLFLHWMHQWRLAALFMISGMGTAFAFRRRTWTKFSVERLKRLLVPMMFGMWTIGFASSVLLEPLDTQGHGLSGFFEVWAEHILWTSLLFWVPIIGKFMLGHLWFLWNLALYSFLLIPIFHIAQKNPQGRLVNLFDKAFKWMNGWGVLLAFPVLLSLVEIILKPWMPGFLGSGYEWMWFLCFFLFGYICMMAKEGYYRLLEERFNAVVGMTVVFTMAFLWLRLQQHTDGVPYVDGGWVDVGVLPHNLMTLFGCFVHAFHAWSWCLLVFALGARYLNHPSPHLAYLNQGVYPFYIVHMPLTFGFLSLSKDIGLAGIPAVLLTWGLVMVGCWAMFELLKRTRLTRALFGIKPLQTSEKKASPPA